MMKICIIGSGNIETQTTQNRPLSGKVAIVTGSSRGIGRAIAERLGKDGAKVVVTYVGNQAKAEEVVSTIQANGSDAVAIKVDMRLVADVRNLFQKTIAQFGQIDILVNDAAGKNIFKPTAEMSEEEYNSMFDIIRGVYFSLQEASHHMVNGGRIVNMSSSATAMAYPTGGAYAGCKAAIEQFSVCLAKELGAKGIVVNMVSPGLTKLGDLLRSYRKGRCLGKLDRDYPGGELRSKRSRHDFIF
jgi:3-oxoacyl-[acyl-carrier protein] reductase